MLMCLSPLYVWVSQHYGLVSIVCVGATVSYIVLFHIVNDNSIVTEQERREKLVRR